MMSEVAMKTAGKIAQSQSGSLREQEPELSEEDRSKDSFFAQIAGVAEGMMMRHGKEFAIGALVLAARFIAEGKPLTNKAGGEGETSGNIGPARDRTNVS